MFAFNNEEIQIAPVMRQARRVRSKSSHDERSKPLSDPARHLNYVISVNTVQLIS